jgi:hypothetical protein
MHDQWEYKLLTDYGLENTLRDATGADFGKLSLDLLNKLGKEGWEVCAHNVSPVASVTTLTLILKRRINPS